MQHPARLLIVTLLLSLSSCSVGPGAGEPSPPAAIYVMNADGGVLERVTAEAGYDLQPAWSLDGPPAGLRPPGRGAGGRAALVAHASRCAGVSGSLCRRRSSARAAQGPEKRR
jgi:hypothetical protein